MSRNNRGRFWSDEDSSSDEEQERPATSRPVLGFPTRPGASRFAAFDTDSDSDNDNSPQTPPGVAPPVELPVPIQTTTRPPDDTSK